MVFLGFFFFLLEKGEIFLGGFLFDKRVLYCFGFSLIIKTYPLSKKNNHKEILVRERKHK